LFFLLIFIFFFLFFFLFIIIIPIIAIITIIAIVSIIYNNFSYKLRMCSSTWQQIHARGFKLIWIRSPIHSHMPQWISKVQNGRFQSQAVNLARMEVRFRQEGDLGDSY
jgi:hypothetical protein